MMFLYRFDSRNLFSPIRMQAKDELVVSLRRCAEILRSVKSKTMKNACEQLEELLCRFQQLDGM